MTPFERMACAVLGGCVGFVALHFVIVAGGGEPEVSPLYRSVLALGSAFGLAVVQPLTARVDVQPRGLLAWARGLAYLSFSVTVLEGLAGPQLGSLPRLVPSPFTLDPYMWMICGGVGLWLLVVNVSAIRTAAAGRAWSYIGCAFGGAQLAFPMAFFAASHRWVDYVVELPLAVMIGVLGPIWLLRTAVRGPAAG